jgi:hypothetical protein
MKITWVSHAIQHDMCPISTRSQNVTTWQPHLAPEKIAIHLQFYFSNIKHHQINTQCATVAMWARRLARNVVVQVSRLGSCSLPIICRSVLGKLNYWRGTHMLRPTQPATNWMANEYRAVVTVLAEIVWSVDRKPISVNQKHYSDLTTSDVWVKVSYSLQLIVVPYVQTTYKIR